MKKQVISSWATNIILIALVASLGGFLFGFDTAVISGTVGFVESFYELSKLELGWFTASALLGSVIGAISAGKMTDSYGRKPILLIAGFLFFISAIGSAFPPNFVLLIVARIIGGLGVGLASVAAPLYISEFAPAKYRGRLVAFYQLSIVMGIILAYLSNWIILHYQITHVLSENFFQKFFMDDVWQFMFLVETLPAFLFFILMFLVPETPRWLIINNQEARGLKVLERIQSKMLAQKTLLEIQSFVGDNRTSLKEIFGKAIRRPLIIGIGLAVFGQLTGVNIVVYYGPTILENAGLDIGGAFQYQVALGLINLAFTIIAFFIIDRFGRRPLLVGGMALVSMTLLLTGVLFLFEASAIAIVVALGLYMASVAVSINAVIWVLTPEIFPNRLRGKAMSVAIFFNWTTNFVAASLFPILVSVFGMEAVFFLLGIICLIGVIFFYKKVPETKGKTLEEIESFWKETSKS